MNGGRLFFIKYQKKQKKDMKREDKEKRQERRMCYTCAHLRVRETRNSAWLTCGKFGNSFVGAMCCRYYKRENPK